VVADACAYGRPYSVSVARSEYSASVAVAVRAPYGLTYAFAVSGTFECPLRSSFQRS
jgi:hypothetical protein